MKLKTLKFKLKKLKIQKWKLKMKLKLVKLKIKLKKLKLKKLKPKLKKLKFFLFSTCWEGVEQCLLTEDNFGSGEWVGCLVWKMMPYDLKIGWVLTSGQRVAIIRKNKL